jgi:hypothetical protein
VQLNHAGIRDSLTITLLVLHWGLVQPSGRGGVAACTIGPGPSGERTIKLLGPRLDPSRIACSIHFLHRTPDYRQQPIAAVPAGAGNDGPAVGPHMRKSYHVTTSFNNSGATACTSLCRVIYNSAPRVLCFQLSSHDSPAHKVADGLVSPIILGEEKVAPVRRALRALGV